MSVLNQSGEEQVECPLCMEPLEVDDLNFFPCTCGYQICRFCWHRIRLDENGGLCPACRKAYSENPADFIPLSREQVAKLKAEKRQRNQQRKALLSESRKHLASVRVVQRNLVFVVGLPPRLADPEILKRHEYFGKFGKIHKVVINQSTSYAGSQGPSASAYVTYLKSDDALRAIQAVNNVTIDNRVIKSSLGTTKYCSHFMKNQPCPKSDCMYLHEYGDSEASFTREQMHLGKHTEYEKKLHDDLLVRTKAQTGQLAAAATDLNNKITAQKAKDGNGSGAVITNTNGNTNKENWPQLDKDNNKKVEKDKVRKGKTKNVILESSSSIIKGKDKKDIGNKLDIKSSSQESITNSSSSSENTIKDGKDSSDSYPSSASSIEPSPSSSPKSSHSPILLLNRSSTPSSEPLSANCSHLNSFTSNNGSSTYINKLPPNLMVNVGRSEDNNSYFSSSGFNKLHQTLDNNIVIDKDELLARTRCLGGEIINEKHLLDGLAEEHGQMLTDSLPNINTTEDWAAAFGFTGQQQQQHSREHELLQQQQQKIHQQNNSKFSTSYTEFLPLVESNNSDCGYEKGIESFNGFYEMSKLQENLMLNKRNGLINRQQQDSLTTQQSHISNGIMDHNMSKFFSDFNKFNAKESPAANSSSLYQNGFNNGVHNSYNLLQQQQQKHQYDEQYRNFNMKQSNFSGGQTTIYQNGIQSNPSSYRNGDISLLNGSGHNNLLYSKPSMLHTQNLKTTSEAELDFDPFQETQKALAEMMANEQHRKIHNPGRSSQINGLIHSNQNNTHHIPPPPPGFLQQQQQQQQQQAHMNSFGSKILPFLSLTNNSQQQQQINNWPNNYQMPPQQKNITNSTCNDWKVLDPAILSSSRSYQLPQIPAGNIRDPYMVQQQQQQNGQIRSLSSSFDYPQIGGGGGNNNPFSAFTQQLQQPNNFNNSFNNLNTTSSVTTTPSSPNVNNLNWFAAANDLNSQISSPPGFRNSQTSKQQEC